MWHAMRLTQIELGPRVGWDGDQLFSLPILNWCGTWWTERGAATALYRGRAQDVFYFKLQEVDSAIHIA